MREKIANFLRDKLYTSRDNKIVMFLDHLVFKTLEDNVPARSGMLAYFIILSIFPFIIALLNLINLTPLVEENFIYQYVDFLPSEIQSVFMGFLGDINTGSSPGLFSISLIGTLWSGSTGIKQMMRAINVAYDFEDKRNFIIKSLVALVFTVALIVMIILLLFTQLFSQRFMGFMSTDLGIPTNTLNLIRNISYAIPLVYMILIFYALYKFSPSPDDRKSLDYKVVIPGAIFATLGIILMTAGFSLYLSNFGNYTVTYGSIAGVIITLIWLYLSSIVILVGGQVNATIYFMRETDMRWPREKSMLKNFIVEKELPEPDRE